MRLPHLYVNFLYLDFLCWSNLWRMYHFIFVSLSDCSTAQFQQYHCLFCVVALFFFPSSRRVTMCCLSVCHHVHYMPITCVTRLHYEAYKRPFFELIILLVGIRDSSSQFRACGIDFPRFSTTRSDFF